MSQTIYRKKLFEDVADRMVEHVRAQKWAVGQRLPSEPEIAELFGVSRATVRAAIKSLQLEGVLRSRGGSGTYVAENALPVLENRELASVMADRQTLCSLVQARYVLEPQLAALAAQNATQEEAEQLMAFVQLMEQNRDRHGLITYGYRFHQAVAEISHNQVLYGFYRSVSNQLRGLRVIDTLTLETFLEGIEEHRAIAKAIAGRDDALAKQLMRSHLKKDYAPYLTCPEALE